MLKNIYIKSIKPPAYFFMMKILLLFCSILNHLRSIIITLIISFNTFQYYVCILCLIMLLSWIKSVCLHCVSFANALLQYLHNLIVIKREWIEFFLCCICVWAKGQIKVLRALIHCKILDSKQSFFISKWNFLELNHLMKFFNFNYNISSYSLTIGLQTLLNFIWIEC